MYALNISSYWCKLIYSIGDDVGDFMEIFLLNSIDHTMCFNVSLVSDGLVEGTENITLSLQQMMPNTSFGIREVSPNTATVTVTDEDCELSIILMLWLHTL